MKENSIEEDITRIKQRIEDVKEYIEDGLPYSEYLDLENSFDNILSDYKKVLKQNEQLSTEVNSLKEENEELEEINNELEAEKNEAIKRYNFETIPIKKVKDKIEELNQYYKKEIYPSLSQWRDLTITEHYDEMIELLRELIKESEE